jgi:hypothetical protein
MPLSDRSRRDHAGPLRAFEEHAVLALTMVTRRENATSVFTAVEPPLSVSELHVLFDRICDRDRFRSRSQEPVETQQLANAVSKMRLMRPSRSSRSLES